MQERQMDYCLLGSFLLSTGFALMLTPTLTLGGHAMQNTQYDQVLLDRAGQAEEALRLLWKQTADSQVRRHLEKIAEVVEELASTAESLMQSTDMSEQEQYREKILSY